MKKWILIIIVSSMLGWTTYDFVISDRKIANQTENVEEGKNDNKESTIGLEVNNIAPDFQLPTITGENMKLSDLRGKRVMINFWATWCPPCRAEMPDMEKFHQDKDIVILAVNLTETEKSLEDVEAFLDEYKLTFPIVMDKNLEVANLYQIQPIPTTYMVDSDGIIRYRAFGALNYDLMVQEFEKMK
ncbi:peroxiredoxin [Cytobacillus eiseniae]|uniref:Peroxiredoxin n=1 Tax=Cytobacillus eiseniae TaxID=762947 RepID=A0ABS4RK60_9BACI|nr:TlpA disulfide reductase family protein [Cytobacillus eiseniae]MBP2243297.1 peroxiredoxin [Cytobacillus eiseniae]